MSDWHELVIEGSDKTVRAFVLGFVAGRGGAERVFFGHDLELERESFGKRLWELLSAGGHAAVFAPATIAQPLAQAIIDHGADSGLRVHHHRDVESVSFALRTEIFARDIALRTRTELFGPRADGVQVVDLSESEEKRGEAHGVELYAPLHEYVYRANGRMTGSIPGVLQAWRELRRRDFLEIGPLHVIAKPIPV